MIDDNLIQTFHLERSNLRGRVLRMGTSIDHLLKRHADYAQPLLYLTGEAAGTALILSSVLKYEGVFTLQVQGDGPVSMVVADVTHQGHIRACARIRDDAVISTDSTPTTMMGKGYLAFTVDQGEDMERYQGIVELMGERFQDSVQHYFNQSEQIATGMRFALKQDSAGQWRAGAIMIQRLPQEKNITPGETEEDDWRRIMVLLQSCTDDELVDANLSQNDLLFRLFHEDGIRVYDPVPVIDTCRCSAERAENILSMLSEMEREEMTIDGKLNVKCEFCNRSYDFDPGQFEKTL